MKFISQRNIVLLCYVSNIAAIKTLYWSISWVTLAGVVALWRKRETTKHGD